MKRTLFLVTGAALAFVASAMPAFSADSGTVAAKVTPESTCITVTPTILDFGTLPFSVPNRPNGGARDATVTSCTSAAQKLFARGTDATGPDATWHLSDFVPCVGPLNDYGVYARNFPASNVGLSHVDRQLGTLDSSQAVTGSLFVAMPCTGSSGAGVAMSFSIVFTATL